MNHNKILLSIVIPAYNYASTLERAVASVSSQLGPCHELIVIDDGSTDDTPSVISRLESRIQGNVRFLHQANGGISSVRNRGIREARGAYLIFLDADDELAPDVLRKLEAHIAANPRTRFIIGGHVSIMPNGKRRIHPAPALPDSAEGRLEGYLLEKSIMLSNGACAMHKDIFMRGHYPESFRGAEDIPVFAQTLAYYPCTVLPEPLALIHKHPDSLRHQFCFAKAGGMALVDEIFSANRLGTEFIHLKLRFAVQRNLSLFRSAYLAKDYTSARNFYCCAFRSDWRVLFKFSYTKKALRLWLTQKNRISRDASIQD